MRKKSNSGSRSNEAIYKFIPFIAAIGVFFLASNSPMWKQMNQKPSVENEVKPIPVKEFKYLENVAAPVTEVRLRQP